MIGHIYESLIPVDLIPAGDFDLDPQYNTGQVYGVLAKSEKRSSPSEEKAENNEGDEAENQQPHDDGEYECPHRPDYRLYQFKKIDKVLKQAKKKGGTLYRPVNKDN
jgi:hypothetical protein